MIIQTYEELKFYIEMFRNGNADLLVIEGSGGTGKSQLVNDVMKNTPHLKILSHITPMQLFILGYRYKDLPIVIDDVDCLLYNEQNISLLKMFCETREIKPIAWLSTHKLLSEIGIPQRYETRSKVIIISNDFDATTKKILALKDRGWHLEFNPTNNELLKKMNEIKENYKNGIAEHEKQKVYDLIEKYSKFCSFSLRTFMKGLMLYKECNHGKNLDWKSKLLKEMGINERLILSEKLLSEHNEERNKKVFSGKFLGG